MTNRLAIIPQPVSIQPGDGSFQLDDDTSAFTSAGGERAAELLQQIFGTRQAQTSDQADIVLFLQEGTTPPEGYRLEVTSGGATVTAPDEAGLIHGVQTLRQLLPPDMVGGRTGAVRLPAVKVTDHPRFAWRGMHLDVGRHFFPVSFIKKFIDLMAFHKMNVFHWHLTEDQGWRIEIDAYPRLAEVSAWRASTPIPGTTDTSDNTPYGGFYTKDEIRQVVAHAHRLGVTVIPEIELPGHTVAVLAAYPELGCTGGRYAVRTTWGVEEDVFCAGKDAVFSFLEAVFDEVLELFPGRYVHIGGDECPKIRWSQCPDCRQRMTDEGLADEHQLQSWFISRIGHYLHGRGRSIIGWDEIAEGGLPTGAAVMSWRGIEGGLAAAAQGHPVVMTPTTHCYFDYYQSPDRQSEPPAFHWPIPAEHREPGGPSFHGLIPLRQVFDFDPLHGVPQEHQAMILGGQSNLWTEHIPTGRQAEYQQYPRGCAMAETLWSPMPPDGRDVDDFGFDGFSFDDFIDRLDGHLKRLDALGVNYRHPKEHLPADERHSPER